MKCTVDAVSKKCKLSTRDGKNTGMNLFCPIIFTQKLFLLVIIIIIIYYHFHTYYYYFNYLGNNFWVKKIVQNKFFLPKYRKPMSDNSNT